MVTRRGFFGLLAAAVLAKHVVPARPVAPDVALRFVQEFDCVVTHQVNRIDVLYGWAACAPTLPLSEWLA